MRRCLFCRFFIFKNVSFFYANIAIVIYIYVKTDINL